MREGEREGRWRGGERKLGRERGGEFEGEGEKS